MWRYKGIPFADYVDAVAAGFLGRLYRNYATEQQIVIRTDQRTDDLIDVLTEREVDFDEARLRAHPRANVSNSWEVPEQCEQLILEKEPEALEIWGRGEIVNQVSGHTQPHRRPAGE